MRPRECRLVHDDNPGAFTDFELQPVEIGGCAALELRCPVDLWHYRCAPEWSNGSPLRTLFLYRVQGCWIPAVDAGRNMMGGIHIRTRCDLSAGTHRTSSVLRL